MGRESRSFLSNFEGLDLEQITVGCLSQRQREQLGIRLEEKREALLCELIFAAKALADANLRYIPADPYTHWGALRCVECKQEQRRLEGGDEFRLEHTQTCRTGQVHRALQSLLTWQTFRAPAISIEPYIYPQIAGGKQKPAETPYDWASELQCDRCGQHGGEGWSLVSQQSHRNHALQGNECELRKSGWSYVYVHNCGASKKGGRA